MKKNYVISLREGFEPASAAKKLEEAGAHVEEVLEALGIITASADESVVPQLERIEAVAAVEVSGTLRIAPPGSAVQ